MSKENLDRSSNKLVFVLNVEFDRKEIGEIYNALCSLNIDIRKGQPKRAKFIQKLIQKWDRIKEFYDDTKT